MTEPQHGPPRNSARKDGRKKAKTVQIESLPEIETQWVGTPPPPPQPIKVSGINKASERKPGTTLPRTTENPVTRTRPAGPRPRYRQRRQLRRRQQGERQKKKEKESSNGRQTKDRETYSRAYADNWSPYVTPVTLPERAGIAFTTDRARRSSNELGYAHISLLSLSLALPPCLPSRSKTPVRTEPF